MPTKKHGGSILAGATQKVPKGRSGSKTITRTTTGKPTSIKKGFTKGWGHVAGAGSTVSNSGKGKPAKKRK